MPYTDFHISEQDLLRAADGELPPRKVAQIQAHLAGCWTCRARMKEVEATIVDFVQAHQRSLDAKLPPSGGSRRVFQARLAEIANTREPHWWERMLPVLHKRDLVFVGLALAVFAFTVVSSNDSWRSSLTGAGERNAALPDPGLTPGTTQPLTRAELCSGTDNEDAPAVPRAVALRVFAAYGVADPPRRAYELDYLIAPELGGTNDIRNLWPQPYRTVPWDAHAKDALEDYLYARVCDGSLDLSTAQEDIALDWIDAYRKYFHTAEPLPMHASFLKDQPWE